MKAIAIAVFLLAAQDTTNEGKVKCASVGGPYPVGQQSATIPLQCCPQGEYVLEVKDGKLICVRDL